MTSLPTELLGWLAFLQRTSVLQQLLPLAILVVVLVQLRRLGRLGPRRFLWLWRLPTGLPMLLGEGLLAVVLLALGQRIGLVLLLAQITAAWVVLRLLERRVLGHVLPAGVLRRVVGRVLRPLLLVAVLLVLLDAVGSLQDLARISLGVWFGSTIHLGDLSTVLLVLYLLLVGMDLPVAGLSLLAQQSLGISSGSRRALDQILRYALFSLGVVWAVTRLGFNQTGMLAVAGGLSVGLGFGITEIFSNIVSGIWLLIEGSVRPGEVLMHEGAACEVRRLGPRATTLWRRADNAEVVVPNQSFFTSATVTYTGSDRTLRCQLELSIDRSQPPQEMVRLLEEVAAAQPEVLARPAARACLLDFGPDHYRYGITYSIADPLAAAWVGSSLRLAIVERFASLGIPSPS